MALSKFETAFGKSPGLRSTLHQSQQSQELDLEKDRLGKRLEAEVRVLEREGLTDVRQRLYFSCVSNAGQRFCVRKDGLQCWTNQP